MKIVIITLFIISTAFGQYPPSGYRPEGPAFTLPPPATETQGSDTNAQQTTYRPSTDRPEYQSPSGNDGQIATQYLPSLRNANFRQNQPQQNFDRTQNNFQRQFRNQIFFQQLRNNPTRPDDQNIANIGQQSRFDSSRVQFRQNNPIRNQDQVNQPNRFVQNPIPRNSQVQKSVVESGLNNRNTLGVTSNLQRRPNQSLRNAENHQDYANEQTDNQQNQPNNQDTYEDQNRSDDTQFGKRINVNRRPTPSQNQDESNREYGSPGSESVTSRSYRKPSQRRRKPESTTPIPEPSASEDSQGNEYQPNVAVATAVVNGQYYLWQPNGQLPRIIYRNPKDGNALSGKLIYTNVAEPIKTPLLTYTAPFTFN